MMVLTFVAVAIGIAAFIQLIRVYELSRELKNVREEEVSFGETKTNAWLFILFMIGLFASYIWHIWKFTDTFLPTAASVHGEATDGLMNFNLIIINIVFVVVNSLLFIFAWRYHARHGSKATYFTHSNKLELIWTVIPSVALAVIIVYGLKVWNDVTGPAPEEAITIEVYSRQFDWTARYSGNDGLLGAAHVRNIAGANFLGIDPNDVNGQDDKVVKTEFHIPVGKPVNLLFRSQDVIHSAYLPHFRAQMNTVPGMITNFHFVPTKTTAEMRALPDVIKKYDNINAIRKSNGLEPVEFDFILLCNKICGASHFNMQMKVVVDTEEDYNKWLNERKTFAETVGNSAGSGSIASTIE